MLANQEVVVIGGDARQLEVIHQLIRAYAKVTLIGYSDLTQFHHTCTLADWSEIDPQKFDLVLLPVSGVQRDGAVEAVFKTNFNSPCCWASVNADKYCCTAIRAVSPTGQTRSLFPLPNTIKKPAGKLMLFRFKRTNSLTRKPEP